MLGCVPAEPNSVSSGTLDCTRACQYRKICRRHERVTDPLFGTNWRVAASKSSNCRRCKSVRQAVWFESAGHLRFIALCARFGAPTRVSRGRGLDCPVKSPMQPIRWSRAAMSGIHPRKQVGATRGGRPRTQPCGAASDMTRVVEEGKRNAVDDATASKPPRLGSTPGCVLE